jgi:hypothetical protein
MYMHTMQHSLRELLRSLNLLEERITYIGYVATLANDNNVGLGGHDHHIVGDQDCRTMRSCSMA